MTFTKLLIAAALSGIACIARADGVGIRADYLCDQRRGEMKLLSVVEATSRDPGEIPRALGAGGRLLTDGKHQLVCTLPGFRVVSRVSVWPPQAKGECGGVDHIRIESMTVNREKLIGNANFAHACWESVTQLELKVNKRSLSVLKCTAKGWEWGTGFKDKQCEEHKLVTR